MAFAYSYPYVFNYYDNYTQRKSMATPAWQSKVAEAEAKVVAEAKKLEDFKKLVAETAWEWDGGCPEGKREFLENLNLPVPQAPYEYTVSIRIQSSDAESDVHSERIQDAVKRAIVNEGFELVAGRYGNGVEVNDFYEV